MGLILGEIISAVIGAYIEKFDLTDKAVESIPSPIDAGKGMGDFVSLASRWWGGIQPAWDFVFGPFGWGFVFAGLLYTLSDWPKIKARLDFLRRRREFVRSRNIDADKALAIECRSLAESFTAEGARFRQNRSARFWSVDSGNENLISRLLKMG